MRKKLFTFFLALAASVGMMNAAADDSGSCGANVTYSFNGTTGAMVISGTGPMTDFASASDAPWHSYRTSITSVTITDGVTSVGKSSFGQCTSLTTVTIGNDVETIGEWAFNDCGAQFTSLTLGNSIRTIGNYAFLWGQGITGFTLPSTLETIGDYAFCQNKVITSLTIPSNVTSIGQLAFYNCIALTSITTEATTPPTLGATVFDKVPTSIPLYVPNGSVAAYTAAAQWNAFNIQGYDPVPVGPTGVVITANQDPDPQNTGVYYATFFDSSVKYTLPAGVEAYVATINVNVLDLTKIAEAGQVIPANNAVILKSTVSPFSLTPSDAEAVTFTATNDLQGTDEARVTPANCYVLSGQGGVVGFYRYTDAQVAAHKAYVIYSGTNAPQRMRFVFTGEQTATGIENTDADANASNAYKIIRDGQLIIIRNGVEYNVNGQEVK